MFVLLILIHLLIKIVLLHVFFKISIHLSAVIHDRDIVV